MYVIALTIHVSRLRRSQGLHVQKRRIQTHSHGPDTTATYNSGISLYQICNNIVLPSGYSALLYGTPCSMIARTELLTVDPAPDAPVDFSCFCASIEDLSCRSYALHFVNMRKQSQGQRYMAVAAQVEVRCLANANVTEKRACILFHASLFDSVSALPVHERYQAASSARAIK